jgi:signal transduction histidine kinase
MGFKPEHSTWKPGLSARLLLLTLAFVMLAEALVFMPSVSNFRKNWLREHLVNAWQIISLMENVAPFEKLSVNLQKELLHNAMLHRITIWRDGERKSIFHKDVTPWTKNRYNIENASAFALILDALKVYIMPPERIITVSGRPSQATDDIMEIIIDASGLKADMMKFGLNILGLSIVISFITAFMVYLALNLLLVKPMQKITASMVNFSKHPGESTLIIKPGNRGDEIGIAERELASMQSQINAMLRQKERLASLGSAVSKINHDLRNILANAQIISDSLGSVDEPTVQRLTPRLISSLDRAIALCSDTLKYGRTPEIPIARTTFKLARLVGEVGADLCTDVIEWENDIAPDLEVCADYDQLYRVLGNLARNSMQAIGNMEGAISIKAGKRGERLEIYFSDTGSGIEEGARKHLFDAFRGSFHKGGSGLGLAISAEIVRAHGGDISLLSARPATFCIRLPVNR